METVPKIDFKNTANMVRIYEKRRWLQENKILIPILCHLILILKRLIERSNKIYFLVIPARLRTLKLNRASRCSLNRLLDSQRDIEVIHSQDVRD